MSVYFYDTDIGNIGIKEEEGYITAVYFSDSQITNQTDISERPIIKKAYAELDAYLRGKLVRFTIPIAPNGTAFMKKVWDVILSIPYGETLSYKQIAEKIGSPKAVRAVGPACNRNPIPLFIPCHRVISSSGKLSGYFGGIDIKERLLKLEKRASIKSENGGF